MDILNFSSPYGDTVLNFGVEDDTEYSILNLKLDLDFSLYPILYVEFIRQFFVDKNLLRYFKYRVTDLTTNTSIVRGSSKYFRSEEEELFSLSLNLEKYTDKNIAVTLELHLEKLEETLKYKGTKDLKIYLGK